MVRLAVVSAFKRQYRLIGKSESTFYFQTLLVLAMIALSFAQDSSDTVNKEATKLEERGFYGGYGGYGGYGYYRRPYYGLYGGYGGYYRRPYYGGYGFYRSGEESKEGVEEIMAPIDVPVKSN